MQRRRFIKIMATSVAGVSLGHSISARSLQPVRWQGYALGAEGQFTLYTETPAKAKRVLHHCFAEIRRLESLFSLYDNASELCQLNRAGFLPKPSPEWQPLLAAIDQAHTLTGGLFDPTVQPLWKAYDAHFQTSKSTPKSSFIQDALALTGWRKVEHHHSEIRFAQHGMSLTLNGIAQGYITDHIAAVLKNAGYSQVLIELGETRALGQHPEGRRWQIGIKDADQPDQIKNIAELANQALATSGSYGSLFSSDGKYHHLIHPKTGIPTTQWKSLSVIAPTATQADALSTGLSFANSETIAKVLSQNHSIQVIQQS